MQTSALARYGFAVFTLAAVFGLGTASVTPARAVGLPPVDLTRLKPASTTDVRQFPDDQVAIGGKAYDGYVGTDNWSVDTGWATWRVPSGYTRFEVEAGVNDESRQDKPSTFRVFVDGDLAKTVKVEPGAKAVRLSVAVRPGGSLKLQIDNSYYGVFAEPRLLAGAAAPPPPEPGDLPPSSPFVVDPRDIDRLAASLRQKADASPVLRQRLASGRVAVSTFSLIDVPSPSVAQNVAEDLYTAMINSGFALVERGQLDKVLKELKIQNMGQVDPKTAQRIGQLSGCDVILLGSISDRGQSVVINARLMEIATGQSIVADRVEMRKIPIAGGG